MAKKLQIFLTGNSTSFDNTMSKSDRKLAQWSTNARTHGKAGSAAWAGMLAKIGAYATGIGAAVLSTRAMVGAVKSVIDAADQVADSSKKLAISAEAYQAFAFAARRSGSSAQDVDTAFKKMASTIYDAGQRLPEAQRAIAKLGLTYDQLKAKSPEQQFRLIGKALSVMKNETDRAALAQDLFGRSGMNLLPMLRDLNSLEQHLRDIGGVMSNEVVSAADAYKDAVEDLSTSWRVLVSETGVVQWLADVAKGMRDLVAESNKAVALGKPRTGASGGEEQTVYGTQGTMDRLDLWSESVMEIMAEGYKGKSEPNRQWLYIEGETKKKVKELREVFSKAKAEQNEILKKQDNYVTEQAATEKAAREKERSDRENERAAREKERFASQKENRVRGFNEGLAREVRANALRVKLQDMVNRGQEREAAILEALIDARERAAEAGTKMSRAQERELQDSVGRAFDATHERKSARASRRTGMLDYDALSDQFRRVGATIGSGSYGMFNREPLGDVERQQLRTQESIEKGINKIEQNTRNRVVFI
jgi:hypothetical protein